jgi:hypothetical protein
MTSQAIDLQRATQRTPAGSRDTIASCIGAAVALLFAPLCTAEAPSRDTSLADGGCGAPIVLVIAMETTSANGSQPKTMDLATSPTLSKPSKSLANASACSIDLTTWRAVTNDPATQLAGRSMVVDVRSTAARVARPLLKDENIVAMPMNSVAHAQLTQSRRVLLVSESAAQTEALSACIALRERGNANAFVLAAGERAWFMQDELTDSALAAASTSAQRGVTRVQLGRLDMAAAARMLDDAATETIEADLPMLSERLARPLPGDKSQRLVLFPPASANVTQQIVDQHMAIAPLNSWWSLATRADLQAVRAQSRTTALAANAPLVRPCGVQ